MSEGQDTASYLKTNHLGGDLGRRGARGAVVMLAAQGLKVLLHIASTVVLARLLTPDDFGVIAMAARQADEIIAKEVQRFMHWLHSLDVVLTIRALRNKNEALRRWPA
ncbi:MAG: hypothetical protein ACREX4_10025 [Gammaproteobacteria bacterium]